MSNPSLLPSRTERVIRARNDLAMGLPCLLVDETSTALCVAMETVSPDRFLAFREALGTPEIIVSDHRARAVMTAAAADNLSSGPVRIRPPEHADFHWFQRLADPKFDHDGGVIGPLHVVRSGNTALHRAGLGLVKSAQLIPAFLSFSVDASDAVLTNLGLVPLDVGDVMAELTETVPLQTVAAAHLPMESHPEGQLHVFREPGGQREHYAIEIGSPDRAEPVLARLHSACFTGDVLGSLKCDCGPQLRSALAQMGEAGSGVLLYLNQEGRGIGLANKMRVYELQSLGRDTVEANHQLGFEDDERDFRLAATILMTLGFDRVRLLTNNPGKVDRLKENGVAVVERLPLRVGQTTHNHGYLATKAMKSGHIL